MEQYVGVIGPTALQVGTSLAAAVAWGIENPYSGAHFPETLPTDFIIRATKPWLGQWVSERHDWSPLKNCESMATKESWRTYGQGEGERNSDDATLKEADIPEFVDDGNSSDSETEETTSPRATSYDHVDRSPSQAKVASVSSESLHLTRSRSMSITSETSSSEASSRSVSPDPTWRRFGSDDSTWQFTNFITQPPAYAM